MKRLLAAAAITLAAVAPATVSASSTLASSTLASSTLAPSTLASSTLAQPFVEHSGYHVGVSRGYNIHVTRCWNNGLFQMCNGHAVAYGKRTVNGLTVILHRTRLYLIGVYW